MQLMAAGDLRRSQSIRSEREMNVSNMFILRLVLITLTYSFIRSSQWMNRCAFFAEIADPYIGATYLTFLTTVSNFGKTWPKYFMLRLVDRLTNDSCDGYYVLIIFCAIYGVIWIYFMNETLIQLSNLPKETSWSIIKSQHKKVE